MKEGRYYSTLIHSVGSLLVISLCFSLALGCLITLSTLAGRSLTSSRKSLGVVFEQIGAAAQRGEMALGQIAADEKLAEMMDRLKKDEENGETLAEIAALLARYQREDSTFQRLVLITGRFLIAAEGRLALEKDTASLWRMNDDLREKYVRRLVEAPFGYGQDGLTQYNTFTRLMGKEAVLVGVLPEGGVFRPKSNDRALFVLDESNAVLYADAATASAQSAARARAALFADSSSAFFDPWYRHLLSASGDLFLWNCYYDDIRGLRYVQLIPIAQLLRHIGKPVLYHAAICFAFFLPLRLLLLKKSVKGCMQCFQTLRDMILSGPQEQPNPLLSDRLAQKWHFRTRLFLTCMLATLPMLLTLLFIRPLYGEATLSYLKTEAYESLGQTAALMEQRLESHALALRQILWDEHIASLLASPENGADTFPTALRNIVLSREISGIRIWNTQGEVVYAVNTAGVTDDSATAGPSRLTFRMNPGDSGRTTVTAPVCKGEQCLGYVEIAFSMEDYLLTGRTEDRLGYRYLFDRTQWQLIGAPAKAQYRALVEGAAQSKSLPTGGGEAMSIVSVFANPQHTRTQYLMMLTRDIAPTQWSLIHVIEIEPLLQACGIPADTLITALIGMLVLVLAFTTAFMQRMMKPIRKIEMFFLEATPSGKQTPFDENDEFGLIAGAYQTAITRIEGLNQRLVEAAREYAQLERRKRESEMIALQSKLDSHLISNIFVSMKFLLKEGKNDRLREVIDATARFFREGASLGKEDVTLAQEYAYLQAYLEIQQFRHGDRIAFDLRIERQDLWACRVPPFILQPVVENAIAHGMIVGRTLHIWVSVSAQGDGLQVDISNDGLMPDGETCCQINQKLLRKDVSSNHIGLRNLQERICVRYAGSYGVSIHISPEDQRTLVRILLPRSETAKEETPYV